MEAPPCSRRASSAIWSRRARPSNNDAITCSGGVLFSSFIVSISCVFWRGCSDSGDIQNRQRGGIEETSARIELARRAQQTRRNTPAGEAADCAALEPRLVEVEDDDGEALAVRSYEEVVEVKVGMVHAALKHRLNRLARALEHVSEHAGVVVSAQEFP